jgi:hypothetical protein
MFPTLVLAAALGVPPCWDIFDSALRASAQAQHPAYVTYGEHITITQDDQPLVETTAYIDYRDDGTARVRDERFDFAPIITHHTEPGPPELGPYGEQRQTWLPQVDLYPTIANVHVSGNIACTLHDVEIYKGHSAYHLLFSYATNHPSLKELWVDTQTATIWKVIVSGYVNFADDSGGAPPLADFEVEVGYDGPYLVVNHVVWSYRRRVYSQFSNYFGEYTMSGFDFPRDLPASYFGEQTAALQK